MSQRANDLLIRSFQESEAVVSRAVTHPLWSRILAPGRKKYAKVFDKTQTMSPASLLKHQSVLLRSLLLHAYRHVPFYRKSMENAGITPLDIQTPEDLAVLPAVTRWYVEHHREDLMARNTSEMQANRDGALSLHDHRHSAVGAALLDRSRRNAGLLPWTRYASMGDRKDRQAPRSRPGALARLVQSALDRRVPFDLSADRGRAFETYIRLLRKHSPNHLLGSAYLVGELAHYCVSHGIDDVRIKRVLPEEGMLSSEDRELVESTFKTKTLSRYGCEQIPLIAWQCPERAGFHVNEDAMILELDPLPGSPAGHGRLLVTDLFNFRMPLIRFEVGHVAKWCEPGLCPCGCSLRQVAAIEETVAEYMSRRIFNLPVNSKLISVWDTAAESLSGVPFIEKKWMN